MMRRLCLLGAVMVLLYGFWAGHAVPNVVASAVEDQAPVIAEEELLRMRSSRAEEFNSRDLGYLLGRVSERRGDLGLALSVYQPVASGKSILRPYALIHLAGIARSTGNLLLERLYLQELLTEPSAGFITESASIRLARNYFESGVYSEVASPLNGAASSGADDGPVARELQFLLGEAKLRMGEASEANYIFSDLVASTPNAAQPDDVALWSVRHLDSAEENSRDSTPGHPLSEAEHFRRASVYQFNREFDDARRHFEAILSIGMTAERNAEAAFQIGRGHAQQENYVEAIKWFERVVEQYPQSLSAKDALLHAASAYTRVGRPREAMTRYQQFIDRYPTDERLDRAHLNIVDILRDQGEDTDALRRCDMIRDVFRGKRPEAIAQFTAVRIRFARNEWREALEQLASLKKMKDLGGSSVPGGTSREELTFLEAFALEKLQRYGDALDAYLSIPDGRAEYYGGRATQRIELMRAEPAAKPFFDQAILKYSSTTDAASGERNARNLLRLSGEASIRQRATEALREILPSLPAELKVGETGSDTRPRTAGTSRSERLDQLGLQDENAIELLALSPKVSESGLLEALTRGDRADALLARVEPAWGRVDPYYPIEMIPRVQLELLYPTPFREDIVQAGAERAVDPRLMLSIMRQESRFETDAKSNAAARGLMQFISATAARMAADLGRTNFRQDELYGAETSIVFGAKYLSDLYNVFPGQTTAVVASYNGGEDNMQRWFNRSRANDSDRYVPEIMYSQSKDYVHRVMSSYRMYCLLYDEKLRPLLTQ